MAANSSFSAKVAWARSLTFLMASSDPEMMKSFTPRRVSSRFGLIALQGDGAVALEVVVAIGQVDAAGDADDQQQGEHNTEADEDLGQNGDVLEQ